MTQRPNDSTSARRDCPMTADHAAVGLTISLRTPSCYAFPCSSPLPWTPPWHPGGARYSPELALFSPLAYSKLPDSVTLAGRRACFVLHGLVLKRPETRDAHKRTCGLTIHAPRRDPCARRTTIRHTRRRLAEANAAAPRTLASAVSSALRRAKRSPSSKVIQPSIRSGP